MGLPEIVDVARNFAVMIRVQGPDPKGLKMRKHAFHHYNSGKTTLSASGMLLPGTFSIDPAAKAIDGGDNSQSFLGSTVVLTVASAVEPFLSLQHRENMISQDKPELIPGVQIDIMVEGKKGVENDTKGSDEQIPHWLSARLLAFVDVPAAFIAVESLVQASSASSEHHWEDGWSLALNTDGPQLLVDAGHDQVEDSSLQRHMVGGESSNQNLIGRSTCKIALLGVSSTISKNLPNLNVSPSVRKGDLLMAMGSPFGVLSPVHFFNSISVGSVANCYPCGPAKTGLLMADIRCLPGMEGGPVFGEHALLIGILTRPLRQKSSGVEIQLVIPWEAIATVCSDMLHEEPQNACNGINYSNGNLNALGRLCPSNRLYLNELSNRLHEDPNSGCPLPSPIEKAMASVCLVTINEGVWASGILLNNKGLVLTNAHLLEPWRFGKETAAGERNKTKSDFGHRPSNDSVLCGHNRIEGDKMFDGLFPTRVKTTTSSFVHDSGGSKFSWATMHRSIRVRLGHMVPWLWCEARVVYVSKGPLDIALLQLEFVPDQLCPIVMDFSCPSPGSEVHVIGHGLFGPRCDFSPSTCVGVVTKVVEAKRPVPYQTSQQDPFGHFPAMLETTAAVHPGGSGGAVVNSDGHMIGLVTSNAKHGGGTTIPHLNFSIPCAALEPIFMFSKDVLNLSLLEDLDKPNEHLSSVWALMKQLSPEPDPSLPKMRQPLPVDVNKDGKGSRFAKFMAERKEVLRESSQNGKMERLLADFTGSKL